jgi:hypothetical protein
MLNRININLNISLYVKENFKSIYYAEMGNQKFNSCKSDVNDRLSGILLNTISNLLHLSVRNKYESKYT